MLQFRVLVVNGHEVEFQLIYFTIQEQALPFS